MVKQKEKSKEIEEVIESEEVITEGVITEEVVVPLVDIILPDPIEEITPTFTNKEAKRLERVMKRMYNRIA